MANNFPRRRFITTGLGAALGLTGVGFLERLGPLSAEEVAVGPSTLKYDPSIEPLVTLIDETPRDRLLEEIAARIRGGLSYREIMAALLLAGVRNIEPRPSVGFKFHAVLVVNAAHIASVSGPPEHRWLPIFWALDNYKSSAARDVRERGDWKMKTVDESNLPAPHKARDSFLKAMENWDEPAADVAVSSLARSAGLNEMFELFFRLGARDFRSIGHKAIFVANSFRTLGCIGPEHAEPILRSLAYALLNHDGDNPARRDDPADMPFRRNQELAKKIRDDWRSGELDSKATNDLLSTLRTGSNNDACDQVVELINKGVSPQSIWDGLFLGAAELMPRQTGIVSLHAVTSTNALHFAFRAAADDETRRLLMLQNAAFLPMFREAMRGRGSVSDRTIADIEPIEPADSGAETIETIFAELRRNPASSAGRVLGFLNQENAPGESSRGKQLIDAARLLVFLKGDDAHDYKFSSAILEDFYHISPEHRNAFLAANVYKLQSSEQADNRLVARSREALKG